MDATLKQAAMPTCLRDECEQPWLRVEIVYEQLCGPVWLPKATAVCEFGHREPVEP